MSDQQPIQEVPPFGKEWIMRLAAALSRLLPRPLVYPLVELGGRIFGLLAGRVRAIVESNLEPVLPQASPRRRRRVAIEVFAHFARSYYEVLYLPSLPPEKIAAMVRMGGPAWEEFQEAHRQGQGIILTSTHQSSFDLAGQSLAARGFPMHVLVMPEQVAALAFFGELRKQQGLHILPLGPQAVRQALRLLRGGGILVMAADRRLRGQGIEVEFFGRPTTLPDGHVRLALQTGARLFGVFCYRERRTYHLDFVSFEPTRSGDKSSDVQQNVQRFAKILEERIRAHPEQWHLMQRVWG